MSQRPQDIFSPEEIRHLTVPSDGEGAKAVVSTWGIVFLCFVAVAIWPNAWTIAGALILLGGRHLALAILMHEAAHYALFRSRRLNDVIGRWLVAYPGWQCVDRYRTHHLKHHKWNGGPKDPDLKLVDAFPTSRRGLVRKIARDLSGRTGLKRIVGLLAMDLGYIEYNVSGTVVKIDPATVSKSDRWKLAYRNLKGVILTNLTLFLLCALAGQPALYLLWVVSYLTTFSLFVRVRSIAEHAVTRDADDDPWGNTRSVMAGPLARLLVAPYFVNYHLEHHLLMRVPAFRLPYIHKILTQRGAIEANDALVAPNYLSVLRLAASGAGK